MPRPASMHPGSWLTPKPSQARDTALDLIDASHVLSEAAELHQRSMQSSLLAHAQSWAGFRRWKRDREPYLAFLGRFFARPTLSGKCFSDGFITYVLYVSVLQYSGAFSLPTHTGRLSG